MTRTAGQSEKGGVIVSRVIAFLMYVSAGATGACCFFLVIYTARRMTLSRFRRLVQADGNEAAVSRLLHPGGLADSIGGGATNSSRAESGTSIGQKVGKHFRLVLDRAGTAFGLPGPLTPELFAVFEIGLAVLGALATAFLAGGLGGQVLATGALGGAALPWVVAGHMGARRRRAIQTQLPFALDVLTLCSEAGLGLESGLVRATQRLRGQLAEEFRAVVHEIRTGKSRHEALRRMADRVNVPDLHTFVSALIQAEQLGSSVAPVFRTLAQQVRQRRAQRAEELAMKAPVKLLFPLVFCIFPALLVILFGPLLVTGFGGLVQ